MTFKAFIIPIIFFLIGIGISVIGGFLKIIHFEILFFTGNFLLTIGVVFKVLAIIVAIIKLVKLSRA